MAAIEKRTSSKGEVSYRVKIRMKGVCTSATFTKHADAKRWGRDTEAAIQRGTYAGGEDASGKTLAHAIARYRREILPHKSSSEQTNQGQQLRRWEAELGAVRLSALRSSAIQSVLDKLLGEETHRGPRSASSVNRYLAAISAVLTAALRWEWITVHPLRGKKLRFQEPKGRVRFLSREEIDALLAACEASSYPPLKLAVLLGLTTGARRAEILGLTWDRVDFDRKWAWFETTKNGERRGVPLVEAVMKPLEAHFRVAASPLLFPSKVDLHQPIDIRKPFARALREAGIGDFRFHDLRHSAASYLAMSGASLAEISELLGHRSLQMVKRYAHLSGDHVAAAAERAAGKFIR
jgi:integrase